MIDIRMFASAAGECGQHSGTFDTSCFPHPNTGHTIPTVLNLVFAITASIALLMIIISGLRYTLAHGDPNGTAQARNSIIYSVVGLVITMAAYGIVTFIIGGL